MSAPIYQQINLYQPIFRKQRQVFSARTMLAIAGLVAGALLVVYGYGLWQVRGLEREAVQLEGRERALAAQLARLDTSGSTARRREVERELERLNATLLEQQRLIEVLRDEPISTTEGFADTLTALARRHARGVWITRVSIDGATGALALSGQALRPELVPTYLQRLSEEPALAGQRFDRFEIERADNDARVAFRVTSRAAGGAQAARERTGAHR